MAIATIPFMSVPQINVYMGIRRWVSTYHAFLPRERLSVYIRTKLPYLSGIQSAHNFQVITAKIHPQSDQSKAEWHLVWSDTLPEMLSFLKLDPRLPDPEQLRKAPADSLKRQEMPNIAMVYSNRISGIQHEVVPGVSPADRDDLLTALTPHWSNWLKLAKPLRKVTKTSKTRNEDPFHSKSPDYRKRWARLQQQHRGAPIAIEVHYQNDTSRDAMLSTLAELLDLTNPVTGSHNRDGQTLTVSTCQLGAIGAELRRTKGDSLRDVAQTRRETVVNTLERLI
ncbi:MAG: DUF3962 domain-containing protein [Chloroflexi bacterium]|nr:DUF3962 domain-containing protein [Chloroflexota bacterium]